MSVKYYDKGQNKWVIFPGTSGVPGKDAYQVAQENGYTGTKEEYNAALANVTNIDKKQDKLISGANIKTINNESILGSGNIITPKTIVEDNLDSINPKNALSANQGNVLKKLINTNTENINTKLSKTDAQSTYQPKGDYALNTALSQETNRAQEVEKGLQTHVTHLESETETLKNKQSEVGQKIDHLDKEMGQVKGDLTKETQRATAAEQANANAIQGINSSKGSANGIATLDSTGHVPASQLPSYVDDILEFASTSAFPRPGEAGKIYVALDTNKTYRWSGSDYTVVSETLSLGETSSTAYPGDKGKKNTTDIAAETQRAKKAEETLAKDITDMIAISDQEPTSPSTELWAQPTEEPDQEVCPEAPKDGRIYGRKNGGWYDVVPQGGYIREQAEAAGAVWHPESMAQDDTQGAYWLNGLQDITIGQMTQILRTDGKLPTMSALYDGVNARTNIPFQNRNLNYMGKTKNLCANATFEVLNMCSEIIILDDVGNSLNFAFYGATKLKKIITILNIERLSVIANTAFDTCPSLEDVKIKNLKKDISFPKSPKLTVSDDDTSTVGYLLINAIGGSRETPITVTFHKTVYDKIIASEFLKAKAQEKFIIIAQAVWKE